jgi:hypothetical protein
MLCRFACVISSVLLEEASVGSEEAADFILSVISGDNSEASLCNTSFITPNNLYLTVYFVTKTRNLTQFQNFAPGF